MPLETPTSSFIATKVASTNLISEYAFNNHLHEIEIYILNESGTYGISPTSILSLNLENSLSNWVVNGDLTVLYSNELGEYLNGNFAFRNDGNDLLRLRIIPKNQKLPGQYNSLNLDKKVWELNYIFSIYNVEDTTPQTGGNSTSQVLKKYRKFYFWDVRYQKMITKSIEYSTATSDRNPYSKSASTTSDETRSLDTDLAMHDIINKALGYDPLLSKTGLEQDPKNSWEKGATKLFYTSPAACNSFEDLMYIYGRHTSSSSPDDFSILDIERGNGDLGYFSLRSLSKYFEKAGSSSTAPGEYQLEHFYLQSNTKKKTGIGTYRAPRSNAIANRDLTFRDYSYIIKYEFVDISPIVHSKAFVTTPVYSFDFAQRQYNVEFKNNSVSRAEDFFNQHYINYLFKRGNTSGNNFLLKTDDLDKQNNYNINPVYSLYGSSADVQSRNPDGLHNLLRTGLFQNTCISFTVPGLTMREPGKFIAIDRPEGSMDGSFDDKLCGQWFVINVIHTFSNGAYYNNITAIKIHRFQGISYFNNAQNFSNLQKGYTSPIQPTSKFAPFNNASNFSNLNKPFQ
jgi:hypothetical protein